MTRFFSLETRLARRFWLLVLASSFCLELSMLTIQLLSHPKMLLFPSLWLAAGLTTAVVGGWLMTNYPPLNSQLIENQLLRKKLGWLFFFLGFMLGYLFLRKLYHDVPEFNKLSDILPAKREYVRRLLAGEIVYRPIPFETYALQPTFLPMRWLPFVFAELLEFDYRWISFIGLVVGLFFWMKTAIADPRFSLAELFLKAVVPFACLDAFCKTDPLSLALAVELLMVGYYLILAKNLTTAKPFLLAVCLVLCLLSRYSLVGWLPVLGLVLWVEKGWKFIAMVSCWLILGIFCLYLLPFCRHDFGKNFLDAANYYVSACFDTWKTDEWQPAGSIPFQHGRGIGFSIFFMRFAGGDLRQKFDFMLRLSLVLSLATTVGLMLFYWFRLRKKGPAVVEPFLFSSLKIFMLIFTGFVVCPFSYLFAIPFFLSVPLFFRLPLAKIWN